MPRIGLNAAFFPHGLPDSLRDRAMGLSVHDQRIDAAADVVDRCVAHDLGAAGLRIDFDLGDRASVGKYRIVHFIVGNDGDAILEIGRQIVARRLLGELEEIEAAIGFGRTEPAVVECDLFGRGAEGNCGDLLAPRN